MRYTLLIAIAVIFLSVTLCRDKPCIIRHTEEWQLFGITYGLYTDGQWCEYDEEGNPFLVEPEMQKILNEMRKEALERKPREEQILI